MEDSLQPTHPLCCAMVTDFLSCGCGSVEGVFFLGMDDLCTLEVGLQVEVGPGWSLRREFTLGDDCDLLTVARA